MSYIKLLFYVEDDVNDEFHIYGFRMALCPHHIKRNDKYVPLAYE